jgi:hypothetical protein
MTKLTTSEGTFTGTYPPKTGDFAHVKDRKMREFLQLPDLANVTLDRCGRMLDICENAFAKDEERWAGSGFIIEEKALKAREEAITAMMNALGNRNTLEFRQACRDFWTDCTWSGSPAPEAPDRLWIDGRLWIDAATGEYVDAETGKRSDRYTIEPHHEPNGEGNGWEICKADKAKEFVVCRNATDNDQGQIAAFGTLAEAQAEYPQAVLVEE